MEYFSNSEDESDNEVFGSPPECPEQLHLMAAEFLAKLDPFR